MKPAIVAEDVTKIYRVRKTLAEAPTRRLKVAQLFFGESFKGRVEVTERKVVDDLNLIIEQGDSIALLGPNGAGKSTFLEMAATGLVPDSGSISIMGYDTVRQREQAKIFITPIFPMFGTMSMWTARQNLEYIALLYNLPGNEMVRRMNRVLSVIDLEARADELVMKFSTGMRVRLMLGMGLMIDQPIYLMDEPFIGIDPGMTKEIHTFLKSEVLGRGRTVLLATHALEDVEQLCGKAALMCDGRIVVVDTVSKLKAGIKGTETINLEVTGLNGNSAALLSHLQLMEGTREATLSGSVNGVSTYRIATSNSRSLLPGLIDAIHREGAKVRFVRVIEPTLEDVFVHYTGRQLAKG